MTAVHSFTLASREQTNFPRQRQIPENGTKDWQLSSTREFHLPAVRHPFLADCSSLRKPLSIQAGWNLERTPFNREKTLDEDSWSSQIYKFGKNWTSKIGELFGGDDVEELGRWNPGSNERKRGRWLESHTIQRTRVASSYVVYNGANGSWRAHACNCPNTSTSVIYARGIALSLRVCPLLR